MSRPAKALIVDDEPHVRVFLRLALQQLGVETCWEAADGAAGLKLALEHRPDLMLLDLNLPLMTGLEVLAALQGQAPEIPVVIVSSQSALRTVHETVRLGAAGYILKHGPKEQTVESLRGIIEALEDDAADDSEPSAEPGA